MRRHGGIARSLGVWSTVVVLGLVGAACGSDGSGKSATPNSPGGETTTTIPKTKYPAGFSVTKRLYLRKVDVLCVKAHAERLLLQQRTYRALGKDRTPRQEADAQINTLMPMRRERIAAMRAVTPPAGDEQTVALIFNAADKAYDEWTRLLKTDPAAENPNGNFRHRAWSYGFRQCDKKAYAL